VTSLAIATAAGLALALSACGGSGGGNSEGQDTLTIAGFGGAWSESFKTNVVAPFEKANDVTVKFVEGGDPVFLAKLGAGKGQRPPYDLVVMSAGGVRQAVGGGLVEPIDTSEVDGWSDLIASLVAPTEIEGKDYGLPTASGRLVLAYRTDHVKTAPTSWSDLADSAYKGHVGLLPPQADVGVTLLAALANAEGGDLSDDGTMDKVFGFLDEVKPGVAATPNSTAEMQTLLERGDVWIAPFTDGRAALMKKSGQPIGLVYPEEGAVPGTAFMSVAKGTSNDDLAYRFLSYMASPKVQGAFCSQLYYICGNADAEYTDDFTSVISTDPEEFAKMADIDYAAVQSDLNDWASEWQSIFG
jgi:putative spermidine/putrescine transport system substrate-binding protein